MIAEAALECVPEEIAGQPAVTGHARKLGRKPAETLLDRSYHHAAMKRLPDAHKRGRPDIVHFSLMEALSTPLFTQGHLKVYVHTYGDRIITVADNLRLPKSYFRFEGLMQSLFRDGAVKSDEGTVLMEMEKEKGTLADLISEVAPGKVVGLSSAGVESTAEQVARKNADSMFIVGGFPKGHFSDATKTLFNCTYSIESTGLEAHVVIARVLYECEKARRAA
ncbi:ribosome biogenesis protein [Candidatus Nitrososphaera sp. FF02]|uniref:ribosome biogenesis protein n=1 Tax=Candidatus Nitrososphaera sp. FF02 TaxID=3398226 RepID=UPI0039E7611B